MTTTNACALRAGVLAVAALLGGCGTLYKEATSLKDPSAADTVIVVGRIDIVPPLKSKEQDIKMGTFDPFDARGAYLNRAILHLADTAEAHEPTQRALNPTLGKTYFFRIPKDKRYMVWGSILTYHRMRAVSGRQLSTESNEILLPAPLEFDIKTGDKAIYVGTWRLHRDEFNEVTKAEVIDNYGAALAEFKQRFGNGVTLRKALSRPPASRK